MVVSSRFASGFLAEPPQGDALWTPFRGSDLLVRTLENKREGEAAGRRVRLLRTDELFATGLEIKRAHYLGEKGGVPCITCELDPASAEIEGCRYGGLRQVYSKLDPDEFHVASVGFSIQYWNKNHQYCAGCGGLLELKKTERAKRCEPCARDFFPPVVPAIIVRVTRGNSVLLTRQAHFPQGMYALVAGFVEPGESLEDCVAREVLEETGIQVDNIRYFGSQPWPFPHQVMVGFTAEYASGEVVLDKNELEEAAFFDRAAMPTLPPPVSIARKLLDDWLT